MEYESTQNKRREGQPVVAICYDFDKTLSPDDMQAQGFIQAVKCDVADFWTDSNALAANNEMDQNLAYMYMMKAKSAGKVLFTRWELAEYGARVKLFAGVEQWFGRIREYGRQRGVIVEHYIISSGLKEMIEGTAVARAGAFERIYASSFYYDDNGVAVWPAQVVNYTNKTQFLFRIEKGVPDINDAAVNDYFSPEELRVPFRNMVYIGDSDTDIPCMKLVNANGGHSIGVYNGETNDKAKVYKMMRDGRVKYFAPADYSEGTELDELVKAIIDRTAANEALEAIHYRCKKEHLAADRASSGEEREKTDLIIELENSASFAGTQSVIGKLKKIGGWTDEQKDKLFEIALNNSQILYILGDPDVRGFYQGLLKDMKDLSEAARKIKDAVGTPE